MEYKEDNYLLLSGIQHFCFCPRQWALIHIEQQWNENSLTAEGRVIHKRVHNMNECDIRNGIITYRGLHIKSDILGLTGTCDAVEFFSDEKGITLNGRSGKWIPRLVEYKHGKSKVNDCDRIQITAQTICLEEMFLCRIDEAHIFYAETRHREKVQINSDLRNQAINISHEMHRIFNSGCTPETKKFNGCVNCSMKDVCMPELQKLKKNVDDYISKALID